MVCIMTATIEEILKKAKIPNNLIPRDVYIVCARGIGKTALLKRIMALQKKPEKVWSVS